jgi:spore coat polysaccharide biosynthesis predicted glycosyltransferase SpsG
MGYDVAFFTEAGKDIGMGHMIRCYTIYTYYKTKGYNVKFYLQSDIDFKDRFDIEYFKWDSIATDKKYDIIFVDSYTIDKDIYEKLDKISNKLVCLDDYNRLMYPKNSIVLNIAPDTSKVIQDAHHKYLLGLDYVPIRDIFHKCKTDKREDYIFIMLGGYDVLDLNLKLINLIDKTQKIVIVDNKGKIKEESFQNTKVLRNVEDKVLVSYMSKAKYAIVSVSMSLYELSFLQIPTLAIATSENQLQGVYQVMRYNILSDYMRVEMLDRKNLSNKLTGLPKKIKTPISGVGIKNIEKKIREIM